MKKGILVFVVIAVLVAGYLLFFFPTNVARKVTGQCIFSAAHRCFVDTARWADWWPKASGVTYSFTGVTYDEVRISLRLPDGRSVAGVFHMAPLTQDSVLFRYECRVGGSRLREEVEKGIDVVLDSFRAFIQVPRNVYGVNFRQTMSHDTTLVTINMQSAVYPTVSDVYRRIDSLRDYIASQRAEATGLPWLNVIRGTDSSYLVTVALPTNRRLGGNARIVSKRFVPWRMIEGDVYGGPHAVEKAFDQMQFFKRDHNFTIIALPYQYLLIDRRQQPDTTKWVTRVCAPIT